MLERHFILRLGLAPSKHSSRNSCKLPASLSRSSSDIVSFKARTMPLRKTTWSWLVAAYIVIVAISFLTPPNQCPKSTPNVNNSRVLQTYDYPTPEAELLTHVCNQAYQVNHQDSNSTSGRLTFCLPMEPLN